MLPNPVRYHVFTGQVLPEPTLYDYITHKGGIVKFARSKYFEAAVPVDNGAEIAGLQTYRTGFRLTVPKVPGIWLRSILEHARRQSRSGSEQIHTPIEQMYHVHYFPAEGWRVSVPTQKAGRARVDYWGGDESSVVVDLHSHHEMEAYFSDIDDEDECGLRVYGVMGRIYTRPELKMRVGVYGDWLEVDPLDIFYELGPFDD